MFYIWPVKVAVMLLILRTGARAAPTERGFLKAHPHHSPAPASAAPSPSRYLKNWLLHGRAAADGATAAAERWSAGSHSAGVRVGRVRGHTDQAALGKQAQMLKMITALEELQRAFNSTLSSRITIMSRANGRNSGRKNKASPAANGGLKPTTVAPEEADSTASRGTADVASPVVTGPNLKKSQTKKTKRVCFWKYCSQN